MRFTAFTASTGLHRCVELRATVQQGVLIAGGVAVIAGTHFAMH